MIAPVRKSRRQDSVPAWHAGFLAMLPKIRDYARIAFRNLHGEARENAMQEVVANCLVAYVRLFELGKVDVAYPTALARYAVAQFRDGRRVGGKLNVHDPLSAYCQRKKDVIVERLDRFDEEENQWREAVVVDTRSAPVPEIVAFRCDFPDWLDTLSRRDHRIALTLAKSEATRYVARKFHVSDGRISQLRRELHDSWQAFCGESAVAPV